MPISPSDYLMEKLKEKRAEVMATPGHLDDVAFNFVVNVLKKLGVLTAEQAAELAI